MKTHIVMNSAGHVSGRARNYNRNYRHIALVEWDSDVHPEYPRIIRDCKGIHILEQATVHIGSTERSYGFCKLQQMEQKADELNSFYGQFKQAMMDAVAMEKGESQ